MLELVDHGGSESVHFQLSQQVSVCIFDFQNRCVCAILTFTTMACVCIFNFHNNGVCEFSTFTTGVCVNSQLSQQVCVCAISSAFFNFHNKVVCAFFTFTTSVRLVCTFKCQNMCVCVCFSTLTTCVCAFSTFTTCVCAFLTFTTGVCAFSTFTTGVCVCILNFHNKSVYL